MAIQTFSKYLLQFWSTRLSNRFAVHNVWRAKRWSALRRALESLEVARLGQASHTTGRSDPKTQHFRQLP